MTGFRYTIDSSSTDWTGSITGVTVSEPSISISANHVSGEIKGSVNPRLIFKVVKKNLNLIEVKNLRDRMGKLKAMIEAAKETGQHALHEELAKVLAQVILEQQVAACGIEKWIDRKTIDRFIKLNRKDIEFKNLEDYPRMIPVGIRSKLRALKKKKIFDDFQVLYTDYAKEEIKTNERKIKEKDPILFGRLFVNPDVYYVIADWIDEHCDLTIEKLEQNLKADGKFLETIPEPDEKYAEVILKEVKARHERLKNTNASNYVSLGAEERASRTKKKKWWHLW